MRLQSLHPRGQDLKGHPLQEMAEECLETGQQHLWQGPLTLSNAGHKPGEEPGGRGGVLQQKTAP
eukprot:11193689-Lingulodinium_polyedra.AAC.1